METESNTPEARTLLQHHIHSLFRAELLIGPALAWVEEQEKVGGSSQTWFAGPSSHGEVCLQRLVKFREQLEAIHAEWCKQKSSAQEKAPSSEGADVQSV